jgi:hypothetical protein
MDFAYVIYVPGLGYLTDSLTEAPWFTWSEEILEAVLFESTTAAGIVQRYLCWSFFKGERVVSIAPFPVNLRVEAMQWQNS